ncbi:outer membrane beta-barrel protein [Elusimicrobiota bacterium]
MHKPMRVRFVAAIFCLIACAAACETSAYGYTREIGQDARVSFGFDYKYMYPKSSEFRRDRYSFKNYVKADSNAVGCSSWDIQTFAPGLEARIEFLCTEKSCIGFELGYSLLPTQKLNKAVTVASVSRVDKSYKLSGHVFPVTFYYKVLVSRWSGLLGFGFDFYKAKVEYDELDYLGRYARGDFHDSRTGLHVKAGTEFFITKSMSIGGGLVYNHAVLDGFEGGVQSNYLPSGHYLLIMKDEDMGPRVNFAGTTEGNRAFKLDMRGLVSSLSLRYYFGI